MWLNLKNRLRVNFDLQVVPEIQLVTLTYTQPEGPQGARHVDDSTKSCRCSRNIHVAEVQLERINNV